MAAVWNLSAKFKMRLFCYKSEPCQPNEPESVGTERSVREVYWCGGAINWRERKVNWMNIVRGSTLKPVGCWCGELKKFGVDGGIKKMWCYETNLQVWIEV